MVDQGKIWGRKVRVLQLWKRMLEMLFETGHPWMTWKDPANVRNPQDHAGVIHNSNLCTEIELNTSSDEVAVCNLASVNLAAHLRADGGLDHERLRETITVLMRMLDNVIDINFYPVEAAANSNLKHRPVGLGVMGLQDALYDKGIPFDSLEAVDFNDEALEAIAYYAYTASSDLAVERGAGERAGAVVSDGFREEWLVFGLLDGFENQRRIGRGVLRSVGADAFKVSRVGDDGGELLELVE